MIKIKKIIDKIPIFAINAPITSISLYSFHIYLYYSLILLINSLDYKLIPNYFLMKQENRFSTTNFKV